MGYYSGFDKLCTALEGGGALLLAEDRKGRLNAMTIGWAQVGVVWGRPVLTVLVRPSRYTHELLENARYFSVCVPGAGRWRRELAFCGSKSGREQDKLRACNLPVRAGLKPGLRLVEGAALSYECEILSKAALMPRSMAAGPRARYYKSGDWHTLYFGEILRVSRKRRALRPEGPDEPV